MNSEQLSIINDLRLLWGVEVRIFNLEWRESKATALIISIVSWLCTYIRTMKTNL
jgi:hypothetical protein